MSGSELSFEVSFIEIERLVGKGVDVVVPFVG